MKTVLFVSCCLFIARVALADDATVAVEATSTEATSTEATMPEVGAKGLSFAVPSGGGPTFGFAYFLAEAAALRVDVGVALQSQASPMGDRANSGGFSIETGYRMYRPIVGKLTWFLQPSVFVAKSPGVGFGDALSAAVTAGVGVEYWVTPQWSFSGSTGVALQAKASEMGSFKNISLTTGTSALAASFYWR